MAVRYRVNCSWCKLSRGNPKLRARIYQAYFNPEDGDERPTTIAREMGRPEAAILNHCRKHLRLNPIRHALAVESHVARLQTRIQKEAELAIDHENVIPKQDFERVIDSVLSEGLDQMIKQEKKISISQLLTAAKIKADYTSKKRGQDSELIKTFYRMAGSGKGNSTPTASGVDNERENRPDSVHTKPPRNALARGPNPLPANDVPFKDKDKHPDMRESVGEVLPPSLSPSMVSLLQIWDTPES